ncbi:hypothetical protein FF38_10841 [Lucilia cuprina]|uniref:Uncharacterized protein n=1 Tax=Lucilia cuprina TaxID=7375 RepID=A0A0L0BVS8_LUCCU|nr:hypothetical protein FF38_10841 [Lucilia cuprina]
MLRRLTTESPTVNPNSGNSEHSLPPCDIDPFLARF